MAPVGRYWGVLRAIPTYSAGRSASRKERRKLVHLHGDEVHQVLVLNKFMPAHKMLNRFIVALGVCILLAKGAIAQESPRDPSRSENAARPEAYRTPSWLDVPKDVLHGQKAIFTSPLRMNRKSARNWALFGGATAVLISL